MNELVMTLLCFLAYFFGLLATLWGIGRFCGDSLDPSDGDKDFFTALCASFVWPLFLVGVGLSLTAHGTCKLTVWAWEKGTGRPL